MCDLYCFFLSLTACMPGVCYTTQYFSMILVSDIQAHFWWWKLWEIIIKRDFYTSYESLNSKMYLVHFVKLTVNPILRIKLYSYVPRIKKIMLFYVKKKYLNALIIFWSISCSLDRYLAYVWLGFNNCNIKPLVNKISEVSYTGRVLSKLFQFHLYTDQCNNYIGKIKRNIGIFGQ